MSIIAFALLSFALCNHKDNWAVLVAGSNSFWNYRHQADIFHTYQTLISDGFNKDHIIVFAYDDIANDRENPWPGEIFNRPNGEDVYKGVFVDYKKGDVKSENFLKVIKGDKEGMSGIGSGKVLESTSEDNVFIFFSDHGSDSLICFPDGNDLYANDLSDALKYMHEKQMYNQLVFYLEACFSGSMFESLPSDLNIYATTAANSDESSYGHYCGEEAVVRGKFIGTCLGDEYSINWMEDTDAQKTPEKYTLNAQYQTVKTKTVHSHVMEYGDLKLSMTSTIKDFQYHENNTTTLRITPASISSKAVSSRNAKLEYLKFKASQSNSEEDNNRLQHEINMMARSKHIFDLFKAELNLPERRLSKDINFDCLKLSIEMYKEFCGFDERDIEHLHAFTNACSINTSPLKIYYTLREICS